MLEYKEYSHNAAVVAWFVKAFGYKTDHLASGGSNLVHGSCPQRPSR